MAKFLYVVSGFALGIFFSKFILNSSPESGTNIPDQSLIQTESTSELINEEPQCPPCEKMKISKTSLSDDFSEDDDEVVDELEGDELKESGGDPDLKALANTEPLELSENSEKALSLLAEGISDRSLSKLSEEDLENSKSNILKDPSLSVARSRLIKGIKRISPLNGKYEGRHYYKPSTTAEELQNVYSELEIAFGPKNGKIEGNFKLIFYDKDGKTLSNSTGSGTNGDIFYNEKEQKYFIKFHGSYVLHVLTYSGKVFDGNIYNGDEYVGYASYKKIY